MGLLSEGTPLSWEETKELAEHVRRHGILQFLNLYRKVKDRKDESLKWGDEVEYIVIKFDHEKKTAKVSLRSKELMSQLQKKEKENPNTVTSLWRPEFADYMIEGTPGKPYGFLTSHFNCVEYNMQSRREEVKEYLEENESLICFTTFPRLGCKDFTSPSYQTHPDYGYLRSLFFPDEAVCSFHPRFKTLARNIRERRGKKVVINMPVFQDKNTPNPFTEDFSLLGDDGEAAQAALPNHIYMDAMGFGMGLCCLQVTFQACDINEARMLYDQLATVCPIMMALSAATPVHRGFLCDWDCRWTAISASVDDRTEEELGLKPLNKNKFRIFKSRYDTIDSYLSSAGEKFNDIDLVYDEDYYNELIQADIDPALARHIAHLFIRDPVSLFKEKVHQDDSSDADHFENIQSTNWQSMRFKPPPPNSSIGWRVEFRPIEVQMTDFENAAFVVFVVLLTRAIISYELDFLIPISKVDENVKNAQKKDSVNQQKFWFRSDILKRSRGSSCTPDVNCTNVDFTAPAEYMPMTINEIINGKDSEYPGLVPLIRQFLTTMDVDVDTQCTIQQYLTFIQNKAAGKLLTTATWIRQFVQSHPDYKQDSVISELINYDLLVLADKIQKNEVSCPELVGAPKTKTQAEIPPVLQRGYSFYFQNESN